MTDEICPHLFGDRPKVECYICRVGLAGLRPPKPKPQKKRDTGTARVDPTIAKMERIYAGSWCPSCDTGRDAHGFCECDRIKRLNEERHEILAWHSEHSDGKHQRLVRSAAGSGMRRAVLRSGVREMASAIPNLNAGAAISAQTRTILGVEPKWRPYRNERADDLPV